MIRPILLSCECEVLVSNTVHNTLQSIQDRAYKVVYCNSDINKWVPIKPLCIEQTCIKVNQSLNNLGPNIFDDYFEMIHHEKNTRRNNKCIRLPKVKTENGRKTFRFQGARSYNDLPIEIITEKNVNKFKNMLRELIRK